MKYGKKKYYVSKGIGLGLMIWLSYTGIATMFQLPIFKMVETIVGYALAAGAMVYGLISL
ncbi:MAG: hypothetical protein APF81_06750 [Desulfosporosinus sp. BRH_c37]|nr:MAG: hypothetical protein APF81_06750 [Desulfosporosinus sp. BRH_c37]